MIKTQKIKLVGAERPFYTREKCLKTSKECQQTTLEFPKSQALYQFSDPILLQNDDGSLYAWRYGDFLDVRRN